jgi:flagellin-like protein
MKIKSLITDDSAVSPVIGVILMVAITVILAAVIGSFVLNLGSNVQQTSPQASFDFENDSAAGVVTVVHASGDTLSSENTESLTVKAYDDDGASGWGTKSGTWTLSVSAGNAYTVSEDGGSGDLDLGTDNTWASGDRVNVVWLGPNGDSSTTLSKYTVP